MSSYEAKRLAEHMELQRMASLSPKILEQIFVMVSHWVGERPVLMLSDSDPFRVAELERGEIEETRIEENRMGLDYSKEEHEKELIDQIFFLFSLMYGQGIYPDFESIYSSVNGQASGSDSYDRALQLTGDISPSNLEKPLHQLLVHWSSSVLHMPQVMNSIETTRKVLRKNGRKKDGNYAGMYLDDHDHYTGILLDKDEQQASHDHVNKCLRLIRTVLKKVGQKRPEGLLYEDHIPYAEYIYGFRNSQNYDLLYVQLHLDHGLQLDSTQMREDGISRGIIIQTTV